MSKPFLTLSPKQVETCHEHIWPYASTVSLEPAAFSIVMPLAYQSDTD